MRSAELWSGGPAGIPARTGCAARGRVTAAIAIVAVLLLCGGPSRAHAAPAITLPTNDLQDLLQLTGAQTPAPVPTQDVEPKLKPVPAARCGPGSRPLAGEQGRVPASALTSAHATRGWTCNVRRVSHYAGLPGGFRVWRYADRHGHTCAYYDSSLFSALNIASVAGGPSPGVAVLDMSHPAHPVETDTLTSLPMLAPHESLNLNRRRGLLAAEVGNGGSLPGLMAVYDVRHDCRHPTLDSTYLASVFGHESGFSPDGRTFWIGGGEGIIAVDVSHPRHPHTIWRGNEDAHGLNLSDDGNTLYDTNPIDGRLTLLDVSNIQARRPNPMAREISRLTWRTVSIPQNTIPVRIGGRRYLIEFDEFAFRFNPPTMDDKVGAARIIDIEHPAHPRVVSNLRLAVNMRAAHKAAAGDPSALPSSAFTYGAHYCAVPREVNPGIVACSFINSGLRIFDISHPAHPREAGYYLSPPGSSEPGPLASDFALSQPAFDIKRHDVWYTDGTTGFYALHLSRRAWPAGPPSR